MHYYYYSAPAGERSIAISLSVCVSVCPRAYLWNRWTDLYELFCADPCGRGSVIPWRLCDTLCTSGFMHDVTFGRNGPYGACGGQIPGQSKVKKVKQEYSSS